MIKIVNSHHIIYAKITAPENPLVSFTQFLVYNKNQIK